MITGTTRILLVVTVSAASVGAMSSNVVSLHAHRPRVAEFFAGVGLARMGLERAGFQVVWANDHEPFKKQMYLGQFGGEGHKFALDDVANVSGNDIPDIELAWASFPCTDLSLAGNRAGLDGKHSSTFYHFTRILEEMHERRPTTVAIENVIALANSHGGEDLAAAVRELNRIGYSVDVLSLDARRFVPQSRPRLFLVGTANNLAEGANSELRPDWLQNVFSNPELRTHKADISTPPAPRTDGLSGEIERIHEDDPRWWDKERTEKFLSSLSEVQTERLQRLIESERINYRTAYRRTRNGKPVWEVRADDISGCLRTARGGSSKQAVVCAGKDQIRIRWMTPLEYARLMGAGDYKLDGLRPSQILFGFGDAVCVDAVEWLGKAYLQPLVRQELATLKIDKTNDETHHA